MTLSTEELQQDMTRKQAHRTSSKQSALETKYTKELDALVERISSIDKSTTESLSQTREKQLSRLKNLLIRKSDIEKAIIEQSHLLKTEYERVKSEVKFATNGRGNDLKIRGEEVEALLVGDVDGDANGDFEHEDAEGAGGST